MESENGPLIRASGFYRLCLISTDDDVFQALITSKIHTNYVFGKYSDVFEGLGCLVGLYNVIIDPKVQPTVVAPRRHPLALKNEVNADLDRLESLGVIKNVTEPTDWASSIVVVNKPHKLRICLDPFHLNKSVEWSYYQAPTVEEIMPQ